MSNGMSDREMLIAIFDKVVEIDKRVDNLETVRLDLTNEIKAVRLDLTNEIAAVRSDLTKEIETVRSDLTNEIAAVKTDVLKIGLSIENEIKPNIQLLAETIIPVAKRYETESNKIESMETDIKLLKKVVAEHSERLNKLA